MFSSGGLCDIKKSPVLDDVMRDGHVSVYIHTSYYPLMIILLVVSDDFRHFLDLIYLISGVCYFWGLVSARSVLYHWSGRYMVASYRDQMTTPRSSSALLLTIAFKSR